MIQHAAAVALLLAQAAPPASQPQCLTRQQAGDLAVVGASIFVRGARDLCRDRLPAGAYLASPAGERYDSALRAEAERRLDSAATGVDSLFSPGGSAPALFGIMLRGLMAAGPPAEIADLADAPSCADVSLMVEAMSSMPTEGLVQFVSAATALGSRLHQQEQARAAERRAERDEQAPVNPAEPVPGRVKPPRSAPPAPMPDVGAANRAGPFICPT